MDYLTVGSVMIVTIGVITMLLWKITQKIIEFERREGSNRVAFKKTGVQAKRLNP